MSSQFPPYLLIFLKHTNFSNNLLYFDKQIVKNVFDKESFQNALTGSRIQRTLIEANPAADENQSRFYLHHAWTKRLPAQRVFPLSQDESLVDDVSGRT